MGKGGWQRGQPPPQGQAGFLWSTGGNEEKAEAGSERYRGLTADPGLRARGAIWL